MWAVLATFQNVDLTGVNFGSAVPATAMGASSSAYNSTVKSMKLPETVTSIGANAFSYMSAMTEFTIDGDHSISLAGSVFYYATALEDQYLQAMVKRVSTYSSGYVYGYTQITEVKDIPSTVTQLWPAMFVGCSKLTKVTVPATVVRFGNATSGTPTVSNVFTSCANLTEVYFEHDSADAINAIEGAYAQHATTQALTYIFDSAFLATTADDADKKYIIVPDSVVIEDLSDDWKLYNFKNVSDASTSGSGSIAGTDTADQSDNY